MLTVEEAAARLGTPVRFVRRLVAQRRITFHKLGRYVRISSADLEESITAGRVEGRDQPHPARLTRVDAYAAEPRSPRP
jgi:excisionase family DNA binding protein